MQTGGLKETDVNIIENIKNFEIYFEYLHLISTKIQESYPEFYTRKL